MGSHERGRTTGEGALPDVRWRRGSGSRQLHASSIISSNAFTSAWACASLGFFCRSFFAWIEALRYVLQMATAMFGPALGVSAEVSFVAAGATAFSGRGVSSLHEATRVSARTPAAA